MPAVVKRLLLAAAAAYVLAWPLAGLASDAAKGFEVRPLVPALCAGLVLVAGAAFAGVLAGLRFVSERSRPVALPERARKLAPWALLLVVAALPVLGITGAWTKILFLTMVYATIAVGLQITIGMAGLLVLGHAGFWAVGAYTYAILTLRFGLNFWLAFPAAGLAAAVAGLVVGLPVLRLRGDYLAVVTLGFGEAIRRFITNEDALTGGATGIPGTRFDGSLQTPQGWLGRFLWQPGGDPTSNLDHECYWVALALLVVCIGCVHLLADSRLGRALNALRDDEVAARSIGIDATRMKLVAFVSSALWAGLAGVVFAVHEGTLEPGTFKFDLSVLFVSMVVLGGLGSIPGAVLGAILLTVLPHVLQDWFADVQRYRLLFFGALMTAMMIVRPGGLLGRAAAAARAAP